MYRLVKIVRDPKAKLSVTRPPTIPTGYRVCRTCGIPKLIEEFGPVGPSTAGINHRCRVCDAAYMRAYRKAHPGYDDSPNRDMEKRRIRERRYDKTPQNKVKHRVRRAIRAYVNGWRSHGRMKSIMGCTRDELVKHLEMKFKPEMSWANYGHKGWHIDHIIPCSAFDLTIDRHIAFCCNYRNLQPLWNKDNMDKKDLLANGESAKKLRGSDPERFHDVVGTQLESLEIVTKEEYMESVRANPILEKAAQNFSESITS